MREQGPMPELRVERACRVQQRNPKTPGTKCFARYESYKSARTLGEVLSLGGLREDVHFDIAKGYITCVAAETAEAEAGAPTAPVPKKSRSGAREKPAELMQEIEELRDRNAALALENRALRTENQELRERRLPPSADTEVETTRMTWRAALKRCPQLTENQVKSLPRLVVVDAPSNVRRMTYSLADVDALAATVAAKRAVWQEVVSGDRLVCSDAIERYPQLTTDAVRKLTPELALPPRAEAQRELRTYARAEVEALAKARSGGAALDAPKPDAATPRPGPELAALIGREYEDSSEEDLVSWGVFHVDWDPESEAFVAFIFKTLDGTPCDVSGCEWMDAQELLDAEWAVWDDSIEALERRWTQVLSGPRLTIHSALDRYVEALVARRAEALVAARLPSDDSGDEAAGRAPKRQRHDEPSTAISDARIAGACPVCLEDLGQGVATSLDCGHSIHVTCLGEYSASTWAEGTPATRTRRGTQLVCPCCRAPTRVARPETTFDVGDAVSARFGRKWHDGVIDEVLTDDDGRIVEYEVLWPTGECNPIPRAHVRAPPEATA